MNAMFVMRMIPGATFNPDVGRGQVSWKGNGIENSITFFSAKEAKEMKKISRNMNDVKWSGNIRFSSTF